MSEIKMIPLKDIIPYENNPRDNEVTVQKLVGLIPKVGFNVPLLLDKDNKIIKGHARYKAATILGMDKVPCIYSDNTDDLNKFDRIADNKVHEFSKWDEEQRNHEIDMIDTDYDLSQLGFTNTNFDDIGFDFDDDDADDESRAELNAASEEERKRKFMEFLQSKKLEEAEPTPIITTQHDIDSATESAKYVFRQEDELVEIACPKCGRKVFVRKDKYIEL